VMGDGSFTGSGRCGDNEYFLMFGRQGKQFSDELAS
jgi:hypothetical protein